MGLTNRIGALERATAAHCPRCDQPRVDPPGVDASAAMTPEERGELLELLAVSSRECPACGRLAPTADTFEAIEAWTHARAVRRAGNGTD